MNGVFSHRHRVLALIQLVLADHQDQALVLLLNFLRAVRAVFLPFLLDGIHPADKGVAPGEHLLHALRQHSLGPRGFEVEVVEEMDIDVEVVFVEGINGTKTDRRKVDLIADLAHQFDKLFVHTQEDGVAKAQKGIVLGDAHKEIASLVLIAGHTALISLVLPGGRAADAGKSGFEQLAECFLVEAGRFVRFFAFCCISRLQEVFQFVYDHFDCSFPYYYIACGNRERLVTRLSGSFQHSVEGRSYTISLPNLRATALRTVCQFLISSIICFISSVLIPIARAFFSRS